MPAAGSRGCTFWHRECDRDEVVWLKKEEVNLSPERVKAGTIGLAEAEQRIAAGARKLGMIPNQRAQELIMQYLELLEDANRKFNLTAVPREHWDARHILDSLSVAPFIAGEKAADIGSGAGLPGIPLAIIAPDRHWTLIEKTGKKCGLFVAGQASP